MLHSCLDLLLQRHLSQGPGHAASINNILERTAWLDQYMMSGRFQKACWWWTIDMFHHVSITPCWSSDLAATFTVAGMAACFFPPIRESLRWLPCSWATANLVLERPAWDCKGFHPMVRNKPNPRPNMTMGMSIAIQLEIANKSWDAA